MYMHIWNNVLLASKVELKPAIGLGYLLARAVTMQTCFQ